MALRFGWEKVVLSWERGAIIDVCVFDAKLRYFVYIIDDLAGLKYVETDRELQTGHHHDKYPNPTTAPSLETTDPASPACASFPSRAQCLTQDHSLRC